MRVVRRAEQLWLPDCGKSDAVINNSPLSIGAAILQIGVREIDGRSAAKPGDLVAALSWLTGRMAQAIALRRQPECFTVERTSHGTLLLRSDQVSEILSSLGTQSFAAVLLNAALMNGARRIPDISEVRLASMEAMERHGIGDYRGVALSGSPESLAAILQDDLEHASVDHDDRMMMFSALVHASAQAIGYCRHKIEPALAVELALSVAFHAGWIDQRKSIR